MTWRFYLSWLSMQVWCLANAIIANVHFPLWDLRAKLSELETGSLTGSPPFESRVQTFVVVQSNYAYIETGDSQISFKLKGGQSGSL